MNRRTLSRRRFLGEVGVLGASVAAGGALASCAPAGGAAATTDSEISAQTVPFRGTRQAGITTAAQDRLAFAAFDVVTSSAQSLAALLQTWTAAAEAMTQGQLVPGGEINPSYPSPDTGEALDLTPGSLTITIGFGPSLFDSRFGLSSKRPALLQDLPPLPLEELDPASSGGDISIQACSDDPQIAFHAVRNLSRLGLGVVAPRWMQLGFGKTSKTSAAQATPRNLMGFRDGTRNLTSNDTALLDQYVWVGEDDQPWLRGGAYQVARRIRMFIEEWDADFLQDQENVFGRFKFSGAPLTGVVEEDVPNFAAVDSDGDLVIPDTAHIRLVAHEQNNGLRILRRGYSFSDGLDPVSGGMFAGLFFIAYVRRPAQFISLARRMATDNLGEYIRHIGSGLFAVPPGLGPGETWATQLFS
jgi:deferrochelatase/peroxidase EfeB